MSHDVQKSQNAFKTPQSMNGAKEKKIKSKLMTAFVKNTFSHAIDTRAFE